jgi:hypothetical protein
MPTYPIKINGITIKTPRPVNISRFNLTKANRVASGLMSMRLIAKKVKLFFKYPAITGSDLKTILDLIDTSAMFFNVTYHETDGTETTKIFYVGEISQQLQRRGYISDDSVWKDVEFNFIEQ